MTFFPEGMPYPAGNMDTKPFWDYCKQHELRVQRCTRCGAYRFHPVPVCYKCQSFEYEWVKSSGRGEVYSRIVVHHPAHAATRDMVPYNVVIVELEDCGGTRLISNVIDTPNDDVRIGMPVELVWEDFNPEVSLYRFKSRSA